MKEAFNKLCTPAKIYFAIAVIAAIIELFSGMRIMVIVMKLVFAFIWTFILAWLCKKGYKSISWFLVLLPYILIALAMLGIYRVTEEQRQMLRAIQLQGAYGQEAMSNLGSNIGSNNGNAYNKRQTTTSSTTN
jgi:predicted PurR-regulated permease PerM